MKRFFENRPPLTHPLSVFRFVPKFRAQFQKVGKGAGRRKADATDCRISSIPDAQNLSISSQSRKFYTPLAEDGRPKKNLGRQGETKRSRQ